MKVALLAVFLLNNLLLSIQDLIPAVLRCSGNLSDFTYYDCLRPSNPGHNTACFLRDGIGYAPCFSICDGVLVGSYEGLKSYRSCKASCPCKQNL
ncbi:hypothetical protein EB796_019828 [Bugula neritina]|uniref:Uncharacterized protein n=1 Tax=Bugula neritina TaxID=10212 RepID=A0A7J7J6U7_BUGNE|nr:hypothetical protein EB796_019828 [Bugula neritina]